MKYSYFSYLLTYVQILQFSDCLVDALQFTPWDLLC